MPDLYFQVLAGCPTWTTRSNSICPEGKLTLCPTSGAPPSCLPCSLTLHFIDSEDSPDSLGDSPHSHLLNQCLLNGAPQALVCFWAHMELVIYWITSPKWLPWVRGHQQRWVTASLQSTGLSSRRQRHAKMNCICQSTSVGTWLHRK